MSDTTDRMQDVARAVESILPPGTGFAVLAFDFDKPGQPPSGRLDYAANAKRPDICRAMINFIARSAQNFAQHEVERLTTTAVEVEEGERQMILLALAQLAVRRPGWDETLTETAKKFGGFEMFLEFKQTSGECTPRGEGSSPPS